MSKKITNLLFFSSNGLLIHTVSDVEHVSARDSYKKDDKPLVLISAYFVVETIDPERVIPEDKVANLTAFFFQHKVIEDVEGYYWNGGGHSSEALIFKNPHGPGTVVWTLRKDMYKLLTVIQS